MWQSVSNVIDEVESWIVLLPLFVQIPLLLAVFLPVCWFLAKAVDPVVEWALRPHTVCSHRSKDPHS